MPGNTVRFLSALVESKMAGHFLSGGTKELHFKFPEDTCELMRRDICRIDGLKE